MHIMQSLELLQSAVRIITARFYSCVHHEEVSMGCLSLAVNHPTSTMSGRLFVERRGEEAFSCGRLNIFRKEMCKLE